MSRAPANSTLRSLREMLVDQADIGEMVAERKGSTVSHQAISKITRRDDFPEGIVFAIGTLWLRDDVAAYLAKPPRRPGPKPRGRSDP